MQKNKKGIRFLVEDCKPKEWFKKDKYFDNQIKNKSAI